MDSALEDDTTLPLDFERSANMTRFKEALAADRGGGYLDSSAEFSEGRFVKLRPEAVKQDGSAASSQTTTMKEYEYQIAELKKENFGLKLRIYFLEERMDDTPEDIFKANIELKVTVEKIKRELLEKEEMLMQARALVDNLEENKIEEHNQELQQLREGYEKDIREKEEEVAQAKQDVDELADKLEEAVSLNQQLNEKLLENTEGFQEDHTSKQEEIQAVMMEKDEEISNLKEALSTAKEQKEKLEEKMKLLDNAPSEPQSLENQRSGKESAKRIKRLEEELNAKSASLEDAKERVQKLEKQNRGLRNQLHEKEVEQHTLSRSLDNSQVRDLEQSLTASREAAHSAKMKWLQSFEEHSELLKSRDAAIADLQGTLAARDLKLERLIQALSSKDYELQQMSDVKRMLERRLDELLRQKERELVELTERLQRQAHAYTEKVDQLEEKCQQMAAGMQEQLDFKDKIIDRVAKSNKDKDRLISDFVETLCGASSSKSAGEGMSGNRGDLVQKLKDHLREKEAAVESAVDEKLRSLEEKELQLQQLRQALRERDRLVEKINSAVLAAQERVKLLTNSCREKDDAAEKVKKTLHDQQQAHQEALESMKENQLEKEALARKLKNSLDNKEQELKSRTEEDEDNYKTLRSQLRQKEKLLEEFFKERSRMLSAQEANTERLKSALRDKDGALREAGENLSRILTEKNGTIQRLQQLLNSKEHELQSTVNSKAWSTQEHELINNKLRDSLQEKDVTIEKLVASGREKDKLLAKLQADVQKALLAQQKQQSKAEFEKLKADFEAKLAKLQSENSHAKMKVENLEHDVQTKDAFLRQSEETISNLRSKVERLPIIEELQRKFAEQSQSLASMQKAKEQAALELAALKRSKLELDAELKSKRDKADMLTQAAQIKDNIIKEMQEDQQRQLSNMQENIGYYQKKAKDLENSNKALKQQLAGLTERAAFLEQEVESYQRRLESMNAQDTEEINRLRTEVSSLQARLQRTGTPRREATDGGPANDDQSGEMSKLLELHRNQAAEGERLNSILGTERRLYNDFIRVLQDLQQGKRSEPALEQELEALKLLRAQLAEGIRQNDLLRAQLRDQLTSPRKSPSPRASPSYEGVYQREVQELKAKLEESERWNLSLQARLNELQPRVSGVGGSSESPDGGLGIVSPNTARRLKQQVERLEDQLQQSSQLNSKLKNQLEDASHSSLQSMNSKDTLIRSQADEIKNLKNQLDKARRTLGELELRLNDASNKMDRYADDLGRLDRDEALLEREHEIETLKLEVQELRRRTGNDMAAQTSPARNWGEAAGQEEQLRSELAESRQVNEHYKKLLDEKNNDLQRLRRESKSRADSPEKARELQEIQRLRREYENGIKTNNDVRRHLDTELQATADKSRAADRYSVQLGDVQRQLDESFRRNDELRKKLHESLRAVDEVGRLKRELENTSRVNESLEKQLEELKNSMAQMEEHGDEARRLGRELQEAQRLNKTFGDQLRETRRSAEEMAALQRDLKEARAANEELETRLADERNKADNAEREVHRLQRELEQKNSTILSLERQSKPEVHSRGVSPFHSSPASTPSPPRYGIAHTQTSPLLRSPPQVSRLSAPGQGSLSEPSEELYQLNTKLLAENRALHGKLTDQERVCEDLKREVERITRNQTKKAQGSDEDLLASYAAEMRELRMRLEESIRTNDALQAQLERKLEEAGEGPAMRSTDKLIIIRENETLRTEILKRDRTNERLVETLDKLRSERVKEKEHSDLLRQQLDESSKALENLRKELRVYEQLYRLSSGRRNADSQTVGPSYGSEGPRSPRSETENDAIALLLAEIRSLRIQLEKSINTNNALRLKLEEQLARPLRSPAQSPGKVTVVRQLNFANLQSEETVCGGLPNDVRSHLKIQVTNILSEVDRVLSFLGNQKEPMHALPSLHNIRNLASQCKTALERLESGAEGEGEGRAGQDPAAVCENKSLRVENAKLKQKIIVQEDLIKTACERLEETNRTKEAARASIMKNLAHSEDVLKGARQKLETRVAKGSGL